ncbi:ORF18 [Retroperitoneal fibromatosis-associated herpesvirus]|uniref:ORF18 n=1 Tax=Retroperitoneal fibromatosis-associated herpesvirus TaxID=111469 RepID=U5NIU6_9GAMA|nr:ORF18 [Retroperitoneal fibromatosis-associated herpesvirus]AGY30701.1 ORF18 [Retroperitoneal fibromatosis-associated herpesvirus]
MLGRHVCESPSLTPGLRKLLWRCLHGKNLNTFHPQELRFLHLVLCEMYNFTLNVYLMREAVACAGTHDTAVLARKVPVEMWKLVYDGLLAMGVDKLSLLRGTWRDALWLHLHDHGKLLKGLADFLFRRLGVTHSVKIAPENLGDGNFLFNLGGALPCRMLLVLGYCLHFWGRADHEPWVRFFAGKVFVTYLILRGYVGLPRSLLLWASETGYTGPVEAVCQDISAMHGIVALSDDLVAPGPDQLAYLGVFDNNAI